MRAYWSLVGQRLWGATFDVLFVALISLSPLIFGRLVLIVGHKSDGNDYWDFLVNGQLSFYSMGSLATLLLICFRKKLPEVVTIWIGLLSIFGLIFLAVLVGVDPTLQAGMQFLGVYALYIYIAVIFLRIVADAIKSVGPTEALNAGSEASRKVENGLRSRKSGVA